MKNLTQGQIIRNIHDGHPYLVINQIPDFCTMLIDLQSKDRIVSIQAVLKRDYQDFEAEQNMKSVEHKVDGESYITWEKDDTTEKIIKSEAAIAKRAAIVNRPDAKRLKTLKDPRKKEADETFLRVLNSQPVLAASRTLKVKVPLSPQDKGYVPPESEMV